MRLFFSALYAEALNNVETSHQKILSDYEYIYDDLEVGQRVLFDDGKITAVSEEKLDGRLKNTNLK